MKPILHLTVLIAAFGFISQDTMQFGDRIPSSLYEALVFDAFDPFNADATEI